MENEIKIWPQKTRLRHGKKGDYFLKSQKQQTSSEYCIKIGMFSILVISSELHVSEQLLYTRNVEMSYELSHISHLQIQILDSLLPQL